MIGTTGLDAAWKVMPIGAGGWLTGIDIAPDNTMVVRTDTYGAYIWEGDKWQQIINSSSMPKEDLLTDNAAGVYEIRIASCDTDVLYMMYGGFVYRSDNKGQTWDKTALEKIAVDANDGYRMDGQKMAIDPKNAETVFVGTSANGMLVTRDGGASWTRVNVPSGAADDSGFFPGITGIAFDPGTGSNSQTTTIYAASFRNGVYQSVDGGSTWTSLTGGPKSVDHAVIADGSYYAIGDDSAVWRYDGSWTKLLSETTNGLHSIAIDPFNSSHIVVTTPGGALNESRDGGLTWSGTNWGTQLSSSDIPWLSQTGKYMSVGGIAFDQMVADRLWMSAGVGVWKTDLPAEVGWATPIVWHSQSEGIEQLVANEIIVPPGGKPMVASWDRPVFVVDDLEAYPNAPGITDFSMGWSIDYASSDPTFIVLIADYWGIEKSGYSRDGGQTWHAFAGLPENAISAIGGTIAASSPLNFVWAPSQNQIPHYTLDGGETWQQVSLPGVADWHDFHFASYLDRTTVVADRVLENTFYMYFNGVYRTSDGGGSWEKIYDHEISSFSGFNAKISSVPGQAGHLFFTGGNQSGENPSNQAFYRSDDGGETWSAVADVLEVSCFGFGKAAVSGDYPAIFIVGWVKGEYGIWQSDDNARTWEQIGEYPTGSLDLIKTIAGDPDVYGRVYVGFNGSGYAYLPGDDSSNESDPPTILGFSQDTNIDGDGITAANILTINGTAAAGAIVKVYDGATAIKTVVADSDGTWSTTTSALADATHSFTAVAIDAAGNLSGVSSPLQITVDTAAPNRPVISSLIAGGQNVAGGPSNLKSVTIVGTAEAGSNVAIFDGTKVIGQGVASLDGSFSVTALLSDGAHSLTAKATDLAGNSSSNSVAVGISIDATPPAKPKITTFTDSGIVGDGITKATTLQLTGAAEAKALVKVYDGNTLIGETLASNKGLWSFTAGNLVDGSTYDFKVTASDSAKNTSVPSDVVSVTVDATSPMSPQIVAYTPGNAVLGVTKSNVITLTGTAEADASIKLYDGTKYIGVTVADDTGAWSFTTGPLSNATHRFAATATDAAGNTSSLATLAGSGAARSGPVQDNSVLVVTVDTKAPKAPSLTSFSNDTGKVGDRLTSDSTLDLAGKAEAGSTVDVYSGNAHLGSAVASSNGVWTFSTGSLQDGLHSFSFKATDIAGNVSTGSRPFQVTIDAQIDAPVIVSISPATAIANDFVTKANVLTLQGTAEPNSLVSVFSGETLLGVAKSNAQGGWTFKTKKLPEGEHHFSATATDGAGNESDPCDPVEVNIDLTAPTVPTLSHTIVGKTLILEGNAGSNEVLTIYDGRTALGTVSADASGAWSFAVSDLSAAKHNLSVMASDLAGNIAKSGALTVTMSNLGQAGPGPWLSEGSLRFDGQITKIHSISSGGVGDAATLYEGDLWHPMYDDASSGLATPQPDAFDFGEFHHNTFLL